MLLVTLGPSLLGNMLRGGVYRAGDRIISAGYESKGS